MTIEEESVEEETPEKPTSPLPPPPPQFANETTLAQTSEQQRSRKSSKESMKSIKEEEESQKVQAPEIVRPVVHQDVRRTVSADEKSISSATSTTITINQLQDPSNSLAASNGNQVTIVTSHPPVIIDNTPHESPSGQRRLSKSLSYDNNTKISSSTSHSEVIIVSNETNKTRHLHESSTDDDYQSYDSLESSPKFNNSTQMNNNNNSVIVSSKARARKLDESEVLIVSPDGIYEEDLVDDSPRHNQMDTSHVSVVTVGDDQGVLKVKDSSGHLLIDSNSDLSNVSDGIDNFQQHPRIANGQMIYNSKRSSSSREDDVNLIVQQPNKIKQRISPDSSVDCSSSTTGSPTRAISENGSMRSHPDSQKHGIAIRTNSTNNIKNHVNHHHDRSDAESISTTTSHDSSRDADNVLEGVQLRRKDTTPPETPPATITAKSPTPKTQRTKEEIQLANLKKKTRKRTRKFEIDGVQVTTTTSKVIYGDEENGRLYDDHIFRKQELRELKLLQKMEKKQFYELQAKEQIAKDQQDKKFEQERMALERTYEADMDVLARQHKQTIEKYEQQQENELRNTSKKIRLEQERELKLVKKI
jgi:STE20-like kinase